MKQAVVKYNSFDEADTGCNNLIRNGWLIKFMICSGHIILVTFERPLLDTTDTGPR